MKKIQVEDDPSFGMFTMRLTKNVGATPGEPFLGMPLLPPPCCYLSDTGRL